MRRLPLLSRSLAVVIVFSAAGASAADPGWSREFASALEKSTYQTINAGAALFNQGDTVGCYRLFQGALISLGPLLKGESEELATAVETALVEVAGIPGIPEKALALRKPLDRLLDASRKPIAARPAPRDIVEAPPARPEPMPVRPAEPKPIEVPAVVPPIVVAPVESKPESAHAAEIKPPAPAPVRSPIVVVPKLFETEPLNVLPTPPSPSSLWVRMGGTERARQVVHDFVFKATNDPRVREGKIALDDAGTAALEKRVIEFLSSKTGGPYAYRGKSLKESPVTGDEFDAILEDLEDVLIAYEVPRLEVREMMAVFKALRGEAVAPK